MPTPITIPRLGWSMEEGTFVGWLKSDGDAVRAGEPLFEVEGEKALQQIEALDSGTLRIAAECPVPGSIVLVGTLLGYLLAPGETLSDVKPPSPPAESKSSTATEIKSATAATEVTEVPSAASATRPSLDTSAVATPRARRSAQQRGVDWREVSGTGRGGRIRERDVLAAVGGGSIGPSSRTAGRLVPITPIRRTIAARMVAACRDAAPVTLTTQIDASHLVAWRQSLKQAWGTSSDPIPSYSDLIVHLVAATLPRHPLLNAHWTDDGIWCVDAIHVGIAVDTPQGLMVPVIRDVPQLDLRQLAVHANELIQAARQRRLTSDQQSDGTFTVTNLGMFGIDEFTPLLNLPQSAILGVGRIRRQAVVRDDRLAVGDVLTLSLTFDHRVADGADAARFLQDLAAALEGARG